MREHTLVSFRIEQARNLRLVDVRKVTPPLPGEKVVDYSFYRNEASVVIDSPANEDAAILEAVAALRREYPGDWQLLPN